jgi:hypothetical protein
VEAEKNNDNIKAVYWVITTIPIVLLNITPYIGIEIPQTIDDETYRQIVLGFSVVVIFLLIAMFSSYKCIVLSEIVPAKIIASLCLLLYSFIVVFITYFFLTRFMS